MVPKPQIYIAENNLKNLAGPMSILNITEQILSIGLSPRHDRVSYGSGRSASIFIRAGRGTRATLLTPLLNVFRRTTPNKGKQKASGTLQGSITRSGASQSEVRSVL